MTVVFQSPAATIVDTRDMRWADPLPDDPLHGIPGAKVKVLSRFDDGRPRAQIMYVAPDTDNLSPAGHPERHYHRTVREWVYTLHGELPFREYERADDADGHRIVYRAGVFLDRRPGAGSAHGMDPAGGGSVGCALLEWKTGSGTALSEPGSKHETVVVTQEEAERTRGEQRPTSVETGPGIVYRTPSVSLLDVEALPWEVLDEETGIKTKVLARFDDGSPVVQLLWVPPGLRPGRRAFRAGVHHHSTVHEFVFVLSGELAMREHGDDPAGAGQQVVYRAGYFLDRKPGPGGWHAVDFDDPSPIGFTCLEWRDRPDSPEETRFHAV